MVMPDAKDKKTAELKTPELEDPIHLIQSELDEGSRSFKDISLLLEQSRIEVGKLTQRNAAVTTHLQQIQTQLEQRPAEEIRQAYEAAIDAQQRLFVMRGQLEKLQNDHTNMERNQKLLERLLAACNNSSGGKKGEKMALANVEMLVNAQEAERQRLSRQMHDGPAQALSNFILQTEIAMRLMDVDINEARNELSNLKVSAMSTSRRSVILFLSFDP